MEQEARGFEDWEMLQISDKGLLASASDDKSSGLDVLVGGSERVIKSDYFSIGSEGQYGKKAVEEDQEQVWFGSDDSSVIGPRLEPGNEVEAKGDLGFREAADGNLGVSGSDLGKNGSVAMNLGEFEGKDELGHGVDVKNVVGFEGIEKIVDERDNPIECWLDSGSKDGSARVFDGKTELGHGADAKWEDSEGIGIESKNSGELILDSGGVELVSEKFEGAMGEDELDCGDLSKMGDKLESGGVMESGGGGEGDGLDSAAFVEEGVEFPSRVESGGGSEVNLGDGEKKGVIWYKLPLELLKFCIFRTSPVWSVSIAAAVVGFVILRKRFYKMRRKSRSIPLKVSMDDKVSSSHSHEHFIY